MTLKEDTELAERIRKAALLNAVKHDGKAQTGAVIGKILGERPELRSMASEVRELANNVIHDINSLSLNEQKRIVDEKWSGSLLKQKAGGQKHLPSLPGVDMYESVVTRFSPNPDCVLHLGSTRAIVLCHEYAHMYKGKFILRFEDTDPAVKRPVLEFYERIREDLAWLGCRPNEEHIQSDRVPLYYEYTERLLKEGNAYVCTCLPELFRKMTLASQPCECRNLPPDDHLERWQKMLNGGYQKGEAVVRVKTDLNHPNPAVRDWPAARVIDTEKYPHPRVGTKYRVWPLYNLACGVDDHLLGVTHIIRGKEHLTNQVRQEFMYRHLGWKYPEALHYGRLKITGAYLSKSKIVQGIREGLFEGWDDPRLATLGALRKRGIAPEAIRKMIVDIGPKTQDVVLSWENLYAYNRKILDSVADRYFFVKEPTELRVESIPKEFVSKLRLHPDREERGFREYIIKPEGDKDSAAFWVSREDIVTSEAGTLLRLMDLFNIEVEGARIHSADAVFHSESYAEAKQAKAQLIHWILLGEDLSCKIIMPDATEIEGVCEKACKNLKPDAVVQFERFGFVRIDSVNKKITAYYSHK